MVCQLAIDYVDNAFSTSMDMAGLGPSFINIRRGASSVLSSALLSVHGSFSRLWRRSSAFYPHIRSFWVLWSPFRCVAIESAAAASN